MSIDCFESAFAPPPTDKDRAIAVARAILSVPEESWLPKYGAALKILAAQYLRELHLPQSA